MMTPERWQRVRDVLEQALELAPEKRSRFLDGVCSSDPSLRGEVESLISADALAQSSFLESPPLSPPALAPGTKLGEYEIVSQIGSGGMGVVYRAKDLHLGRDVAIKVLPAHLISDPNRLKRFEQEARSAAALNHPNILSVHQLGSCEGAPYLVSELLEGETLREQLRQGALAQRRAMDYAEQIADGLNAAHEKGIVHRDLKPENVFITRDSRVKILDFGLAKLTREMDSTKTLTTLAAQFHPRMIAGTVGYMSPEQVRGEKLDTRTDLFSFGVVLYEIATGKRPFEGDTSTATFEAILNRQPIPPTKLNAKVAPGLENIISKALEKDREVRYQHASDIRADLRRLRRDTEPPHQAQQIPPATRGLIPLAINRLFPRWLLHFLNAIQRHTWAAIAVLTLLVLSIFLGYRAKDPSSPNSSSRITRSIVKLEPGYILDGWRLSPPYGVDQPTITAVTISSDGRFIIYSAIPENSGPHDEPQLYLRRTDALEARPIPGTEGGIGPFLSPDDRWVAFWAGGNLRKVSVDGGIPVSLADRPCCWLGASGSIGSWGLNNKIVFVLGDTHLYMVPADGGNPEVLTTPDRSKDEFSHCLPHWLPDGESVLFTVLSEWFDEHPRVAVLDLRTRTWRVLLEDAADARYVPTGHLVFLRDGTLMVVPFNLARRELSGKPVPAVLNVVQALNTAVMNTASGQFSISNTGSLVYASGGTLPDRQDSLVWVDMKGNTTPVTSFQAPFWAPRLSPNGHKIAYITEGREWHAWIYDLDRRVATQLTAQGKTDFAMWTPKGSHLIFKWWAPGKESNIFEQPDDGSSPMQRLTSSDNHQVPGSISPDGATLAFTERNTQTHWDINLLDMNTRKVTPWDSSKAERMYPEFSPDGHWMAYTSGESGRTEVYVRPFPGPGAKWQLSAEGGLSPLWSRDGKRLFFLGPRGEEYFVADVHTDGTFSASKPRLLFKTKNFAAAAPARGWDISLDGQKFLAVKYGERKPQPITELILVQNWLEEVKRLAPTTKK